MSSVMNPRNSYGQMVQQQRSMGTGGGRQAIQPQPMRYQQQPPPQQQQAQRRPGGGGMGGMMGGGMGSMMSDERSKKEIAQLESANEALTKALSSKAEYPDTGASSSGMQALGQQTPGGGRRPGDSDQAFADRDPEGFDRWADARGWSSGPAEQVAAQNVAMQQTGAPAPQAQGPQPGQSDVRNPWGVQTSMPNMRDLDEAYAKMAQGGIRDPWGG